MDFTSRLLNWYERHQRNLPWRETRDPYKIWLSEIILQQTRIVQGVIYYERFISQYPDVFSLAEASEDEVLALWQGLGYYSRARNLHTTARIIAEKYKGEFPPDYKELLKLKGIGNYTAAAIASIAFDKPEAAVDGNVIRVLARYFGIQDPVDDTSVRKNIENIAREMLPGPRAGDYNQALMDFGSLVCKPKGPLCHACPFAQECVARLSGKTESIPVKSKKIVQKERFFHFFLFYFFDNGVPCLFIEKRNQNDIWKNLYQLPLLETTAKGLDMEKLALNPVLGSLVSNGNEISWEELPFHVSHQLTHQRIEAFFYKKELEPHYYSIFEKYYKKVSFDAFRQMGKPVLITRFLEQMDEL
jgi:A/G-specific adenine glycosylase